MKFSDTIILAHKNNLRNKRKFIFIGVIVLIFLLIFIPFSVYYTLSEEVMRSVNNQSDYKIIRQIDADANLDFLEGNEHIVEIKYYPFISLLDTLMYDLDEDDNSKTLFDTVSVAPGYEYYEPTVTLGSEITQEYDIICPEQMAYGIFDDQDVNDFVDMTKYLNEEIEITFMKLIYNEETMSSEYIYIPYTFKLVGVYDASDTYSYNTCYISGSTYESLEEELRPYNIDEYNKSTIIYVDKQENVEEITDLLDANGISYFVSTIDDGIVDIILDVAYRLVILLIVASLIILTVYLKIFISDRNKTIALYKALGIPDKNIRNILYTSILELLLTSFIISLIIVLLIKYIILFIYGSSTSLNGVSLVISYYPCIIYILIVMVIFYLIVCIELRKLKNKNVRDIEQ